MSDRVTFVRRKQRPVSSPYSLPLAELLLRESARAERYNHFFSVLLIRPQELDAGEVLRRTRDKLRACDVAGILDREGLYHRLPLRGRNGQRKSEAIPSGSSQKLVIVLPETGRTGAKVVERRIQKRLMEDNDTHIGIAVYPDDSTRPENLLDIARAGDNVFRQENESS